MGMKFYKEKKNAPRSNEILQSATSAVNRHRFQTIASKIILDFVFFHEGREDSLINRIIISYKKQL